MRYKRCLNLLIFKKKAVTMSLEQMFIDYYFYYIFFIFITLVILFSFNIKFVLKHFKSIKKTTLVFVLLIFLCGLMLRVYFIPHVHHVYYDEFNHLNIAEHLVKEHKFCSDFDPNNKNCILFGWPPGFHFLLSLFFTLFGISDKVAYTFNSLVSCFSLLLIFFLTYLFFKNEKIALFSMFLLNFLPVHLKISGTTTLMPIFFFFILLTFIFAFIYIKEKQYSILLLFFSSLLFTVYIRPENFIS